MPQSPTPNMGLIQPTEGGDANDWDVILTALFLLVDAHDHTTGKGVKVPSAGLNINADISFGGLWATTAMRAVDFTPVAPADVASLAGAFFVNSSDSNNLYFRTVSGSNVKVTDGTTLNVVGFAGGIGGDYSTAGALVAYVAADDRYTFKGPDPGGGRPWEALGTGHHDFYEQGTTVANRVRVQSPAALAASYALTFPGALPASTSVAQVSSAGVMTFSNILARAPGFTTADVIAILPPDPTDFAVTGTAAVVFPISLPVGSRITAYSASVFKDTNAATTITADLRLISNAASGSGSTPSTASNSANAPGAVAIGNTGLTQTLSGTNAYYVAVYSSSGDINDFIGVVYVTYDRPT